MERYTQSMEQTSEFVAAKVANNNVNIQISVGMVHDVNHNGRYCSSFSVFSVFFLSRSSFVGSPNRKFLPNHGSLKRCLEALLFLCSSLVSLDWLRMRCTIFESFLAFKAAPCAHARVADQNSVFRFWRLVCRITFLGH